MKARADPASRERETIRERKRDPDHAARGCAAFPACGAWTVRASQDARHGAPLGRRWFLAVALRSSG
ncbi:MAG: hypothetical protein U1F54_06525 [Burkholderiales bacterium]